MRPALAVAHATLVAAWRGGPAPAMAGLLAALLLWLPSQVGRDDVGLWQITLSVAQALLLLGTGWLAVDSVGRDLREGQAALLATRPLSRGAWWLGRWLGVVAVAWVLLAGVVMLVLAQARGRCPLPHTETRAAIDRSLVLQPDQPVTVSLPGGPGELRLTVRAPEPLSRPARLDLAAASAPDRAVDVWPDRLYRLPWPGGGSITLTNRGAGALAVMSRDDLRLRCAAGNPWANLGRVVVLMALQLAFIAALGAAAASCLSHPVALFAVLAWLVAAAHAPLLPDAPIVAPGEPGHHEAAPSPLWLVTLNGGRLTGLWVTDALHHTWRLGDLGDGRLVPGGDLVASCWRLGLGQTGAVLLIGVLLWRRREFGLEDRP
ncbi:MAG: hypothetical protein HZB16_23440 [Armatimonadetes bacterium]|nr:hypothetical protein [Armatimonadota bacterium]